VRFSVNYLRGSIASHTRRNCSSRIVFNLIIFGESQESTVRFEIQSVPIVIGEI